MNEREGVAWNGMNEREGVAGKYMEMAGKRRRHERRWHGSE